MGGSGGGGPKGWGPGPNPKGWGPEGLGARRVGGPKGWGPEGLGARRVGGPKGGGKGGGAEGWGAQNFALFFLSPAGNFILSYLSGGSSRGILVVFEAPRRSNVDVWALGEVPVRRAESRRRRSTFGRSHRGEDKKEGASSPGICPILGSPESEPRTCTGLNQPVLNAGCADASTRMDRDCGRQFAFEPVQPPLRLTADLTTRVWMLDFVQFDFGQFDFGQLAEVEIGRSRNWPKSKLAEVEIGRSRNWPKSKLAEVEIG